MSSATYIELQQRTAEKLGLVATGQTVSADDGNRIGQTLLDIQETLAQRQVVFLDVLDGVDRPYADPLAHMAAAHLVDEFGVPEPKRSALQQTGGLDVPGRSWAERRIRAIADSPTTKLTTDVDFTKP
jgi:hypothetical protein